MAISLSLDERILIAVQVYVYIFKTEELLLDLKRVFDLLLSRMSDEEKEQVDQAIFDYIQRQPSARQ